MHPSPSCGAVSLLPKALSSYPLGGPLFRTTHRVELLEISTDESLEIWRRQGLFNTAVTPRDVSLLRDQELRLACACTAGVVAYVAAAVGAAETEKATTHRHRAMRIALEEYELQTACARMGGLVAYVAPANSDENDNDRLARRHRLEMALKDAGAPDKADRGLEAACQHTNGIVAFVRGGASESAQAASNRRESMRNALREHHLREACGGVAKATYVAAAVGVESATDRATRHAGMLTDLRGAGAPEPFEWLGPENGKDARQRLREVAVARRQAQELRTDGLQKFLADELGNLPLSVKLCGHMLRATSGGALCFGGVWVRGVCWAGTP